MRRKLSKVFEGQEKYFVVDFKPIQECFVINRKLNNKDHIYSIKRLGKIAVFYVGKRSVWVDRQANTIVPESDYLCLVKCEILLATIPKRVELFDYFVIEPQYMFVPQWDSRGRLHFGEFIIEREAAHHGNQTR